MSRNTLNQVSIRFSVDPADRSVGIMAEGFAAWFDGKVDDDSIGTDFYCELTEVGYFRAHESAEFEWFDGDSGEKVDRPKSPLATVLERTLWAFAHAWYAAQETGDDDVRVINHELG